MLPEAKQPRKALFACSAATPGNEEGAWLHKCPAHAPGLSQGMPVYQTGASYRATSTWCTVRLAYSAMKGAIWRNPVFPPPRTAP